MNGRVLIVGGGFAGVWAALGAARLADELGSELDITLVSGDPWLTLRPRLYEATYADARYQLDRFLEPVGIQRVTGWVNSIDVAERRVTLDRDGRPPGTISWGGLVLAAGSQVTRPPIPGRDQFTFTVDTYEEAEKLDTALQQRSDQGTPAPRTLIIGGGFAGIEVATEMVGRLRRLWPDDRAEVVLIDRSPIVAATLGDGPRPVIEAALRELGIRTLLGGAVTRVTPTAVEIDGHGQEPADVVIWTAGMRANPLATELGVPVDELGRVTVDETLAVEGVADVWAAGDVARAYADEGQLALQSCQHAQPQGRVAGHNVAARLLGAAEVTYHQPHYVTCLDLGPEGALFAQGWDRSVRATGDDGKAIKRRINWDRIVPPTTGQAEDLLAAAGPLHRPVSPSFGSASTESAATADHSGRPQPHAQAPR